MLMFLPLLSFKSLLTRKASTDFSFYLGKVSHKTPEGSWSFELYGSNIIKTTFHPYGYTTNEQISNAVIKKPSTREKISVNTRKQLIDFGGIVKVLMKESKYSFQFGSEEKNVLAEYFSEHEYRGFRFHLKDGEQIFGGGERALPHNRRGYGFSLYNGAEYCYGEGASALNYSVPFIISSKGYGIFFDNASKGYIDIGRKDPHLLEAGFTSGELTFYIINGKNVDEILKNYTELVGRQPVPARWVFGNLMSRFGYRSEKQLLNTVAKMKEENFPIDAVILDLFWFGDSVRNTLGNLDWVNNNKWPDPKKMIDNLKNQGIKTVLITEPYVLMGTNTYSESRNYHAVDSTDQPYTLTNFYFGFGGLLDLFRKDAQDWFWTKYKKQIQKGIAGWWGDLGEPETHPADMHHNLQDLGFERLFKADEVHNIYGHYWNKMIYEKYSEDYPAVRLFNLNRSGYAGSQRYSVFPWSGDVGRNWSGLRAQLPIMLGMSISGVPYIHADAGGFAMGEKDPELYTRWLQFAAFTPVFRPHGTALEDLDPSVANIESEPVFYPEPYKSIVRKYIQLRYDLLPYNYTLGYQQAKEGKPLTRPMFYYDAADPDLLKAEDQYMWGDNILIAPVLEKGASQRSLYLPKGEWYNYFTKAKVQGAQWITVDVDIENIPFYIKAGSFIPVRANMLNTEKYQSDNLSITYFPDSSDSSYTMYDDDGNTNLSLEKGMYELLHFQATVKEGKYIVQVSSNGGVFDTRPSTRNILLTIPGMVREPLLVKINGYLISVEADNDNEHNAIPGARWDSSNNELSVALQFSDVAQIVEVLK